MGYSPWGCKELDTTNQLTLHGYIINTCICMAELLCCVLETVAALLTGYTPI